MHALSICRKVSSTQSNPHSHGCGMRAAQCTGPMYACCFAPIAAKHQACCGPRCTVRHLLTHASVVAAVHPQAAVGRVKTFEKLIICRAREGQIALLLRIVIKMIDYAESFPIC